VDKRVGGR